MLKLSKLMGALILADFLQDALDAQDVLKGGGVAAAAADQVIVEQVNRRARGVGAGVEILPST